MIEASGPARVPQVTSPSAQLAWLSLAMFLGMTMWFSATAANGPIVFVCLAPGPFLGVLALRGLTREPD